MLSGALLAGAAAQQPPPAAVQDGDEQITLASDLVVVPVSIRRENGGAVLDLRPEEIGLTEDGVRQDIEFFNHDTAPIDVVLLVDSSGSVDGVLDVIQSAAYSFAKALRPEDRVSIVAFSDIPVILVDWTDNLKDVASALRSIEPKGNTALYGSVIASLYERFDGRPQGRRRAVIVLTDGDDTISSVTSRSAARAALQHDASVYVISIGRIVGEYYEAFATNRMLPTEKRQQFRATRARILRAEERLVYMADQTGGRALFPRAAHDLSKAYAEIAEEIRSRYILGYYPRPNVTDGFHELAVTSTRKKVHVHARQGYFK